MKLTLILLSYLSGFLILSAQVGIVKADEQIIGDFPVSSAALEVRSSDQGFLAPRVELVAVSNPAPIENPKTGLVVYNSTVNSELDKGYYHWNGVQWFPWRSGSNSLVEFQADDISVTTLGYLPIGSSDTAPDEFISNGIKGTKVGCAKFTTGLNANGHSYCSYSLRLADDSDRATIDWMTAFNLAKAANGYLVTTTTSEEWNFVRTNFLDTSILPGTADATWLGFRKISYPGNPLEFTWITGERSIVAWENAGGGTPPYANYEFHFVDQRPSSTAGYDCVHVTSSEAPNQDRQWENRPCTDNDFISLLIVEYQN